MIVRYLNREEILKYFKTAAKRRMTLKLYNESCKYECQSTIFIHELKEYHTFVCPLMDIRELTKKYNNCNHYLLSDKEYIIKRYLEYFDEEELLNIQTELEKRKENISKISNNYLDEIYEKTKKDEI